MCLCIGMFNLKNLEHEVKNNLFLVSYKLSVYHCVVPVNCVCLDYLLCLLGIAGVFGKILYASSGSESYICSLQVCLKISRFYNK